VRPSLPRQYLNTVFHALVMSRILYALPVWSGYLSAELIGQINSLLKRAHKYGLSSILHTVENMADVADKALFEKILANIIACMASSPLSGLMIVLDGDLGGTHSSYPAVHLNGIKDPLYHNACISISDRVLIQVYSWSVFEECPWSTGSLLGHFYSLLLFSLFIHN